MIACVRDHHVKSIESLGRGIDVLLALQGVRCASLQELHRITGVPKSSLIRILRTPSLPVERVVERHLADLRAAVRAIEQQALAPVAAS